MKTFSKRVVAITGAGSGIGQALALELGKRGARLALSDRDDESIAETKERCRASGFDFHAAAVDVADRQAVYAWADEVKQHFGEVHGIINNAGVALAATVEEMSIEDFEWLMDINFWGVVYGTKAFLPMIKASGDGHVVNISSIFGIIAVPAQSAYNASKFAVKGFTEALAAELALGKSNASATVVHPGGVKTQIVASGRFPTQSLGKSQEEVAHEFENKLARTTAATAAQIIANGMLQNKLRIMVGTDAKIAATGQRLMPNRYLQLVVQNFKRRTRR